MLMDIAHCKETESLVPNSRLRCTQTSMAAKSSFTSMDKRKEIINILNVLISPQKVSYNTTLPSQNELMVEVFSQSVKQLEKCFEENVTLNWLKEDLEDIQKTAFNNRMKSIEVQCSLDIFLMWCQKLLICLKNNFTRDPEQDSEDLKNILSIQQKNTISTAIQLIISLGIVPYFSKGIGIPLSKRSNYSQLICGLTTGSQFDFAKYLALKNNTKTLLSCKEDPELGAITQCFKSDLIAALFQLSHIPLNQVFSQENVGSDDCRQVFLNSKKEMRNELQKYLVGLSPITCIKEILVLQGNNSTATPIWFRKICSMYLTQQMVVKNGVLAVVSAILLEDEKEERALYDWQKCEIVSKIIVASRLPNQSSEEYWNMISPQVLALLRVNKQHKIFIQVVVNVLVMTTDQYPELARTFLWTPLLQPLYSCSKEKFDNSKFDTEIELAHCITSLNKIFVRGSNLSDVLLHEISPVMHILFHLYKFTRSTVCHLREKLQSLLVAFLKHNDLNEKLVFFKTLLFPTDDRLSWNSDLKLVVSDDGRLSVTLNDSADEFSWLDEVFEISGTVMDLLHSLNDDSMVSPLFIMLLKEFTVMRSKQDEDKLKSQESTNQRLLLEIEEKVEREQQTLRNSIILTNLLGLLSEDTALQDLILKDKISTLKLLETLMSRACKDETNEEPSEMGILSLSMSLLIILISKELSIEEKFYAKNLLPSLLTISKMNHDETVKTMAEDLYHAIETDGKVRSRDKQKMETVKTSYEKCLDNLKDPFLPVRGHALIELRKLIEKKDSETLYHAAELLEIFDKNLEDEDSYIYLAAIQGLTSLADRYTDRIVPRLTAEFANFDKEKNREPELRLKLGEVLVKITQTLGDMTPKYRDLFLHAFLNGCKDPNSHIRASSLSNLGEVCKGLRFAVGPCLHEIIFCIQSLLKTDSAVEVKQACLLVLTLLIRGLGSDIFQFLDSVLRDLFRLLTTIYTIERNDSVKLHAQLAIEEINIATKQFLTPKQNFEKKINILDPT